MSAEIPIEMQASAEIHKIFLRDRMTLSKRDTAWRACLSVLIPALDARGKSFRIAESLPYEKNRFDRTDFLNAMANMGWFPQSDSMEIHAVDERLMPCLFIPAGNGAPCILLDKHRLYAGHKQKIVRFPKGAIQGEVLFFKPYTEERTALSKTMREATGDSWFRALFMRFRGTLWNVMALGLTLNVFALATPLFIMLVYDRVISSHAPETLPVLAAGVALAIAMEWGLRRVRSLHLSSLAGRLDNIVGNLIFSHLLNLSPSYIERASVPSQIARIKTFESIRDFFSGSVFLSVLELPFMVIALIAIGIIAGPLVFVPIAMAALYLVLFYMIWRRVRIALHLSAKAASARQKFSLETVDKLEAINNNGLAGAWSKKYQDVAARDSLTAFHLGWLGMMGETLANALTILSAVAVVGFGVSMIWAGTMTTGALVATMILVWRVLTPFYGLCTMIPRLDQIRNSVIQVNKLMDIETEQATHRTAAKLEKIKGRITFVNVGLRYANEGDPLFSGLNFEAMPGEIIAVTGTNGSGKTSLLKMVKGMYAPLNGSIRIDGFDMRQLDPVDLRRHIAYVPQNTSFFHGTIAENLRFGNPLTTRREMEIALGQAGLLAEIMALPQGMDTMIGGDSPMHLSSSLELRLSMVRAYLHEAPILLLDELPNSLLTEEAGTFLRDNLIRHKKNRTVIMVTHRDDFMAMADKIVLLERGRPPHAGPSAFMLNKLRSQQW